MAEVIPNHNLMRSVVLSNQVIQVKREGIANVEALDIETGDRHEHHTLNIIFVPAVAV